MNRLALQVRDVHVTLGGTAILRGVSLDVLGGERLAIIGPNGAGKSTLFQAVCGSVPLRQGDVALWGRSLGGLPVHRIRRLGLGRSFQTSQLYARLSVRDNLCCAVQGDLGSPWSWWRPMAFHRATQAHAAHMMDALGLTGVAEQTASTLSYAQQRTLELGMALGPGVRVLLLDEPTAGLSRAETTEFLQTLGRVTAGMTVVLVEHDMDVVFGLADRVAVLEAGRVLAVDTVQAIRAHPDVRRAYLGTEPEAAC